MQDLSFHGINRFNEEMLYTEDVAKNHSIVQRNYLNEQAPCNLVSLLFMEVVEV